MVDLLLADKLRGLLYGLLAGEALGAAARGLDRKAILRRYGRLVHMPDDARPGPRFRALVTAIEQARLPGPAPGPRLAAGAVAGSVAAARAIADLHRLLLGEDDRAAEAGRLAASAAAVAIASDPYLPVPPVRMLRALTDATLTAEGRAAVATLRAQVVRPPAPAEATTPFAIVPAATASCLTAVQALLIRPRSIEEAVVWAVNLGGDGAERGALTGALAGLHRGAASVPERWVEPLAPDCEAAVERLLAAIAASTVARGTL